MTRDVMGTLEEAIAADEEERTGKKAPIGLWKWIKEGAAAVVRKIRKIEIGFLERRIAKLRPKVKAPARRVFKRAKGKTREEAWRIINKAVDEGEITYDEFVEGTPQIDREDVE